MAIVVAIDAGTTGVRCIAFDEHGDGVALRYRELTQHYPRPGWVEHDAMEIWTSVQATLVELVGALDEPVAAIGIANQRETVVAWDRRTGEPRHRAIVWQDRRTAERCAELIAAGHQERVRSLTGLPLDPYFSGTKMEWLLGPGGVAQDEHLALGTIDSWLVWHLTGGEVHATDVSNASRTQLCDIRALAWSEELCALFGVTPTALPRILPSSGRFGVTSDRCAIPAGIPISGIAGDQQAALFGQACFESGMTKSTYGTGTFLLTNVGPHCPEPFDGALTTVAWQLGDGSLAYALEGSVFVSGAAIQWMRDGLGIIGAAPETGPLASSVADSAGVFVVPAFAGLGSPWWDPFARGTIVGISRGVTRAHLARAVVEAIAYQARDALDAMVAGSGRPVTAMRVDGGASQMDLLLQLQADQLGVPVSRPRNLETTAMGAAFLAGLAEGVWDSLDDIASTWQLDVQVEPAGDRSRSEALHGEWLRAVERSRHWDH